MPPSPSLRRSPSMEPCVDSHKRGRSLESGLSFKERDDDLALFNEMQSKETDNFLLQPTDDFEDIFSSRVKTFPDIKLGINIPARGESSDLLNADGDKNDYEWLLTPPDTPLFPSLDDEPAPANIVHSGRARSRPVSISRSSTMERSQRSSRGSPSPQRLSPSPRSGSGVFQGRPSSAPHSNPVPLRPNTPSRRPSPPPVKPSTPPPRSSTPTSRRSSASPGGPGPSSGLRGTSPVRTSRANSTSPKIMAWQSNIPGFSLEAPPNLRTSLADRPASYVRGSSPASRTSRESSSKPSRQSMSPTATRSISSSHSKGSVASSGDDDADSLHSVPVSVSERPMSRKGTGAFSNGRPLAFSKKPMKTLSPSSAPKRSFDSAMRQMDRKSPQNMFRPLLSSVPSSTFYAGKANVAHRTMISRNSSVTTSSNASSDQATSGAHDTEESDQYQDDTTSNFAKAHFPDVQDDIFAFDKVDVAIEHAMSEAQIASNHDDFEESSLHVCAVPTSASEEVETDSYENRLICSICGAWYHSNEFKESEHNICPECKQKEELLIRTASLIRLEITQNTSAPLLEESKTALREDNTRTQSCSDDSLPVLLGEETVQMISEQQVIAEERTFYNPSESYVDPPEGAGISLLLLKRSSSVKGPLIHARTLNSSAISYDDLSYARDLTSSMRSSTGHGSISTSSSIDLASARPGEVRRSDTSSKPQSTVSSLSGTSMQVCQGFGASTSSHEENYEGSVSNMQHILAGETPGSPSAQHIAQDNAECHDVVGSVARCALSEDANGDICTSYREKDEDTVSNEGHEIDGKLQKSVGSAQNMEEPVLCGSSVVEESTVPDNEADQMEVAEDPLLHSVSTMSEIEINDSHPSSPRSQNDTVVREDFDDPSAATCPEKDVNCSSTEVAVLDLNDGIVEESTVTVEDPAGRRARSMTLEEATDTILFCSSIIHDLAYKAASIAIEKEKENLEPLEGSRPTVTIPEKRGLDRNAHSGFTAGRAVKTQKTRKKRSETEAKPPLTQNDEMPVEPVVRNVGLPNNGDSMKTPKLESKCNCTIM